MLEAWTTKRHDFETQISCQCANVTHIYASLQKCFQYKIRKYIYINNIQQHISLGMSRGKQNTETLMSSDRDSE